MNTPAPNDDETMRALQRDAARVPHPAFHPALHRAAMRQIHALGAPESTASRFHLWPTLAATAAVLTLSAIALWRSQPEPARSTPAETIAFPIPPVAPRTSQLAYQNAARQGDEALFALLDRDAQILLPASSPIFNAPLN